MTPTTSAAERIEIDVRLPDHGEDEEVAALRAALSESPRRIPSRYFYDDRGSELFEHITELPEYYQTRTEAQLLRSISADLVSATGIEELVELGSGAATKTRILLDSMQAEGTLRLYVPLDVSEGTVRSVAKQLVEEYDDLIVRGIVGDFLEHLDSLPLGGRRLVLFLGGTIGNLRPEDEAVEFLERLAAAMDPGDLLLLGTDLIKDTETLQAAYNDSQGVTARFNLNALRVLNRRFGADFDLDTFSHRAFYDRDLERIEMRLVSQRAQTIEVPPLDLSFDLRVGDELLTEISTKYDRPKVERLLDRSGFELERWYSDPDQLFALSLASRRPTATT